MVEDSILFFDTVVGREARVVRTIADNEVHIGSKAFVGERGGYLTVIGSGSSLPEGILIQPGFVVYPNTEASSFASANYSRDETARCEE